MNLKITTLYLSKVSRIVNGNYPPIICYAIGNKKYENTICDCKKFCKYSPGNTDYISTLHNQKTIYNTL